nr:EAL domain-containing protein [Treponema sp.]
RSIYDCSHYTFALMIDEQHSKYAKEITNSITDKFSKDWVYNNLSIPLSVVMGVVNIPLDLRSVDAMMLLIDTTEYNPHERVSIIKENQLRFLQHESTVAYTLEKAIKEKTLQVYYQPIWDLNRKCVHGAETFIRLKNEYDDFIPPEDLIFVAEKNGLIRDLGLYIIEELSDFMANSEVRNLGMDCVVANLSATQCLQKDLPFLFKDILDSHGVRTEHIYFDVRETTSIMTATSALQTLRNLRDMGFNLALDNYGTGHTDVSSIFKMGFITVKIDKSVLRKAVESKSAQIFLHHTVCMLKEMKFDVAIEGVEIKGQEDIVKSLGLDFCQGYYYSKPLPRSEFIEFCRKIKDKK